LLVQLEVGLAAYMEGLFRNRRFPCTALPHSNKLDYNRKKNISLLAGGLVLFILAPPSKDCPSRL
jgi:hypothetical protein